MTRALPCLVVALIGCGAPAAPSPPPTATDGVAADVELLVDALDALHPALHRHATRDELARARAALDAAVAGPVTTAGAYRAIATYLATIRCGHTYANFWNQTGAVADAIFAHDQYAPFEARWLDGALIVTRPLAEAPGLVAGAEIVAIDGVRSPDILAALRPLARADGANDAARVRDLDLAGLEHDAFDVYLPLAFPRRGPTATLVVRAPDGATSTIEVTWLTRAARAAARRPDATPTGALWSLDIVDASTAVLRMPTWVTYDSDWDWQAFVAATFDELARRAVPSLIIDLRGNGGGTSEVGDALLARLAERALPASAAARRVRYRAVPEALRPHLETWDPSFFDWGDQVTGPDADGFYAFAPDAVAAIAPIAPRYGGRVVVLVDGANSSATFRFAQLARAHGLATLVGEPTGGNLRGTNGGAIFFLRLPHTGIEVDIPLIATVPPGGPPDAGLVPDVVAIPTPADLAAGVDRALVTAMSVLTDCEACGR